MTSSSDLTFVLDWGLYLVPADLIRADHAVRVEQHLMPAARSHLLLPRGLLVGVGVIRSIWNGLRKDFLILPRLAYARAQG